MFATRLNSYKRQEEEMLYQDNSRKNIRTTLVRSAAIASLLMLPLGNAAMSDDGGRGEAHNDRALRLLDLTAVDVSKANTTAGAMYSFDISFVDQKTQTYYLADRSNKAVDVVDAKTGKFLRQISKNFAGFTACVPPAGANDCAGPNGVVAAFPWLFVTDAGGRVVSIDLRQKDALVGEVFTDNHKTGFRADELAYDPQDGMLLVINNADTPPFGTLISVNTTTGALTLGKRITFVDAENGAEQPVWDPTTRRFYLSIPQIGSDVRNGGVVRINLSGQVEATYPVRFCGPAGLTLGPTKDKKQIDALIGCNTVFDTAGNVWSPTGTVAADPHDVVINLVDGAIDSVISGAGAGDEVWYNKGDNNYYASGSGSPFRPLPAATAQGSTPLAIIDAIDEKLAGTATTFNVPAGTGHPASTAHSVAANADNNHVFVPLGANNAFLSPDGKTDCLKGCIAIFGHPDEEDREGAENH